MTLLQRFNALPLPIKLSSPPGYKIRRAGRYLLKYGDPEAQLLKNLVEPNTTALDVGANIGNYSFVLAKVVGPAGKVISIEPLKESSSVLAKGAKQLHLPVSVVETAVSDFSGHTTFFIPKIEGRFRFTRAGIESDGDGSERREVPVTTLDDIAKSANSRISFVKIDVEGHEHRVIAGGRQMLSEHRPNLLIEIEQRHHSEDIHEIFDSITALGYRGLFIDPSGIIRPLETFDLKKYQDAPDGSNTDYTSRNYVNNFIFLPV